MESREQQKKKAAQPNSSGATRRQAPMKVIESGETEQGELIEPRGQRIAGRKAGQQKLRENYRHGGIPIGSDPRE